MSVSGGHVDMNFTSIGSGLIRRRVVLKRKRTNDHCIPVRIDRHRLAHSVGDVAEMNMCRRIMTFHNVRVEFAAIASPCASICQSSE